MLFRKIHQLRSAFAKIPPTAIYSHCSWWFFGSSTSQLVDFSNQHFAVSGFSFGGVSLSFYCFQLRGFVWLTMDTFILIESSNGFNKKMNIKINISSLKFAAAYWRSVIFVDTSPDGDQRVIRWVWKSAVHSAKYRREVHIPLSRSALEQACVRACVRALSRTRGRATCVHADVCCHETTTLNQHFVPLTNV